MSKKHQTEGTFLSDLPKNIFSGFVVSLIALPLALGLALASEAPPISGIIASVVGGFLISFLGGSNVTITGPGNGLVVVLLGAITTLGNGDLHQGYLYTLAAIVFSGALMALLGFLRMGTLADFFPASAIQGMLAAIGIGIFAKQFHVMLGNSTINGSIIELVSQAPNGILQWLKTSDSSVFNAGLAGVVSLLIMIFYGKIRNRYFQLIPAPMWIVILAIGMSYYYEYFLKSPYPIHSNLLINIPNDVFSNFAHPDFSIMFQGNFIAAVLGITFISSIESLLSIKAVDKLDPLKRRSNVNRDLKALGAASIVSGFLGGLNVVTVIARSSVNVNNNGTNRSSNFFHAAFLVLFILLFQEQLRKIPLSALAAILVYTGYKLTAPDNIIKVFKIGKEQLLIFLTTLLVTIATSLITGILTGIAMTFVIHIILNKSFSFFFKNVAKPNVLMYKEGSEKQNYYVSVTNFCNFLNFYKLKNNLDQIPENEDVIVDFSMCDFVDHTVMLNLSSYIDVFNRKGGHFEVIGLDLHGANTKHPFALRRVLPFKNATASNLTKRQKSLQKIAKEFHWDYTATFPKGKLKLSEFGYFKTRKIKRVSNVIKNKNCSFFDVEFTEGEFIAKQIIRASMMRIELNKTIPSFTLDKEGLFEYIYHFTGYKDIDLKEHPDFSKRFFLSGEHELEIRQFFTDALILFFESNPYYHIESNGKSLLIVDKERLASTKETKALTDFGLRLEKMVS